MTSVAVGSPKLGRGPALVVFGEIGAALHAGDLFAIAHEARTGATCGDLVLELCEPN